MLRNCFRVEWLHGVFGICHVAKVKGDRKRWLIRTGRTGQHGLKS